jgi:hypothetical protein
MAEYTAVSLTPAARDALRTLTLELPTIDGRRLPMSEVLEALVAVGRRDLNALLAQARAGGKTSGEG